jgi:type VI secretion system protein VasD
MNHSPNRFRIVLLSALAVLAGGCGLFGSKKPPIPEPLPYKDRVEEIKRASEPQSVRVQEEYVIKGTATDRVNRDANGRPLSVVVRLYQLKDNKGFSRLGFDAVARGQREEDLFPKELESSQEMILIPGTTQSLTDKLSPDAKYIGVVAVFRSPDTRGGWRFLVDARAARKEGLNFTARECSFTLIQPEAETIPGQLPGAAPECATFFSR